MLARFSPGYVPFHPQFGFLFNSYYNAVGPRWARPQRGLLSRPTVEEVYRYRAYVDELMGKVFLNTSTKTFEEIAGLAVLGIHHEQQHQELMVTDLKHAWAANPLHPVYQPPHPTISPSRGGRGQGEGAPALPEYSAPAPQEWLSIPENLVWIGHEGDGFAFDNETPRHRVFLPGFQLVRRLVTNAEYLAFINDGGYDRADLWLSDGWAARQSGDWKAPLYWQQQEVQESSATRNGQRGDWSLITLAGLRPFAPPEPVCHVSYYEADAFARWAGPGCPQRRSGKQPPPLNLWWGTSWKGNDSIPQRSPRPLIMALSFSCMAMCGSGRQRPMPLTPVSIRPQAHWESTTPSSCATSLSCAAPPAPRRAAMRAGRIVISFLPTLAGNSAASAWQRI